MFVAQEHLKAKGFAVAFWNKVVFVLVTFPLVLHFGIPQSPHFYLFLMIQGTIWAIADIIMFNSIASIGAGVISRILPLGIIFTFLLWLPFDLELVQTYLANPLISAGIFLALSFAGLFAFKMKKCEISWGAIKRAWFVILGTIVSPVIVKAMMQDVDPIQGAVSFAFFEAAWMIYLWIGYYLIKKPMTAQEFMGKRSLKAGMIIGIASLLYVITATLAMHFAANPAYVSVIGLAHPLIIVLYYKIKGIKEKSDVLAGLGIVLCAAALILLESFI